MGTPASPLADRFWGKVGPADANGCRRWGGYHNPQTRYGQVTLAKADAEQFGSRIVTAPVLSATLTYGPRPEGMYVLHSCDNRACCAPEHLRWDTQAENNREAWERGCQASGEDHHQAKVSDEQVVAIIRRARAGESPYALADEFGMDFSTIYGWLRGEGRGRIERTAS
jgi:hypothetical protein